MEAFYHDVLENLVSAQLEVEDIQKDHTALL
jgi:hypothetical protein